MDWRDDHTLGMGDMRKANKELPTFLYAMPFSKTKVCVQVKGLCVGGERRDDHTRGMGDTRVRPIKSFHASFMHLHEKGWAHR